jgi:CheY-like chemotaxis protein
VGQDILESLGYRVLVAVNGREALETYLSTDRVDLVITDMVMPEIGGRELVQKLKKANPRLKALAMTGYTLAEDPQELRKAGIMEVIQKPFEMSTLGEVVRRALDARGA